MMTETDVFYQIGSLAAENGGTISHLDDGTLAFTSKEAITTILDESVWFSYITLKKMLNKVS